MHQKILTGLALLSIVFLFNCCIVVDPVKEKCEDWAADEYFAATLDNLYIKAQEFISNPNKTTCLAYKNAYQDYLDELKDWQICYEYHGLGDAYESQLDAIESTINSLDCDL